MVIRDSWVNSVDEDVGRLRVFSELLLLFFVYKCVCFVSVGEVYSCDNISRKRATLSTTLSSEGIICSFVPLECIWI